VYDVVGKYPFFILRSQPQMLRHHHLSIASCFDDEYIDYLYYSVLVRKS